MTPKSGNGAGPSGVGEECFVVCVDDDAEFVKSLELFLQGRIREHAGTGPAYRFLFFTDPQDALETLDEIKADRGILAMVISDQQMPQMKGTAFLARVRERYPQSIRVLLTGHAGLESAITAINDQLLDKYLTKPVENEHDFTVSILHLLQRFWMQRTIDSQRRILGELYRFSDALNALTSLPVTIDQITQFAREAFGCNHASVWMLEGDEMVCQSSAEDAAALVRVRVRAPDVERLCDSRTARVSTLEEAPLLADLLRRAPGSMPDPPLLRATLLSGSQVLGSIVVGDRTNGSGFEERDEEILTYIADTASIAIYNRLQSAELARSYEESSAQALQLAAANDRLRILDRMKDDFLTFVSHELRTPLTVLSAIEFLDLGDRPEQANIVKVLRSGYDRLKRFIETALTYRAWIVGEPMRGKDVLAVPALVQSAREQIPGLAEAGARFEAFLPSEPCLVRGNASDLIEIVRILLDNAVRFSPDGVHISVRCEATAEAILLSVEDRGLGFAPELAEEILKPFTIADSLHHRSGSALNLAKANAIAIAYGGGITAESAGEGEGAKFTVRLPRVQGSADAEPAPERAPGATTA